MNPGRRPSPLDGAGSVGYAPRVPAPEPVAFGRYLLETKLASGGMGEVFLARMQGPAGFEKKVVIKRILPHLAQSQEFVDRFLDEGRLVVQLSQGNIVQVFDMGTVDGHYYLAMEFVDGVDLRVLLQRLRRASRQMPVPLVLHVVAEVCKGLAYAHSRTDDEGSNLGIIHRDVSPSNVMISREGEVKLLDFGIAKAASRMAHSVSGSLHGKFLYMSPEQAAGKTLDRRSDLFSLGTCMYEMLTGLRPFYGDSELRTLELIRTGVYVPPSKHREDLPAGVEAIVAKCLTTDPEERFRDADELMHALLTYLVTSAEVVTASDLSGFLGDHIRPRRPSQPISLNDALNQQLDALLSGSPGAAPTDPGAVRASPGTQVAVSGPPEVLGLADTMTGTPTPVGGIRPDTHTGVTTGRARLPDLSDANIPRASRNRILIVSVVLLVGVLVAFNVMMLYTLRSNTRSGDGAPDPPPPSGGDSISSATGGRTHGQPVGPGEPDSGVVAAPTDTPDAGSVASTPDAGPTVAVGAEDAELSVAGTADAGPPSEDLSESVAAASPDVGEPAPDGASTVDPPIVGIEPSGIMMVRVPNLPPRGVVKIAGTVVEPDDEGRYPVPQGDGAIDVAISAPGHHTARKTLERVPGEVAVEDRLMRQTRKITVSVDPPEARIVIGRRVVGTGTYRVTVSDGIPVRGKAELEGYHPKDFVVRYAQKAVSVTLEPRAFGRFEVRVFPVAAEVRVDGRRIRRSAAFISQRVAPGTHRLVISHGDATRRVEFTVEAGETQKLGQYTVE